MKNIFLSLLLVTAFSAHAMEEDIENIFPCNQEEFDENSVTLQAIKAEKQVVKSYPLTEILFEYKDLQVKIIENSFFGNCEMHYHDSLIFSHENKAAIFLDDLPTIQQRKKMVSLIGVAIITRLVTERTHRPMEKLPIETMIRHDKPLF